MEIFLAIVVVFIGLVVFSVLRAAGNSIDLFEPSADDEDR